MSGAPNSDPTDTAYPEQRHAGKVGYGPNYHVGASFADIVAGLAEEVKGKIKHDPTLIQRGHEKITGEEKRKELLGEKEPAPKKVDSKEKKHKRSKSKEPVVVSSEPVPIPGTSAGGVDVSKGPPIDSNVSVSPGAQHHGPNQSHHAMTSHISKHDPVH